MALDVLVVGGGGLMGVPIARALLAAGHRVTAMSRSGGGAPGAEGLVADRRDAESLSSALTGRRFDLTIDLLAYDAADVERLLLLPIAALGRYLMISSGQVYLVTDAPHPPFREPDAARPVSPEPEPGTRDHREWAYGVGKRRAEAALRRLRRTHGVRGTALRLPVVQGAGDPSRRLWAYLQRLLDGDGVLLPGGGEAPVRFVWAEDVARAVVMVADGAPATEAAYNLAGPDEWPLRELLTRAAALLGVEPRLVGCDEATLAAAGLDHTLSPYSGRWCSRPDPARAAGWGFVGSTFETWLPPVVAAHLAESSPVSHPGYAHRDRERALMRTLASAPR